MYEYTKDKFSILAHGRTDFCLSILKATFIKTSTPLCKQKEFVNSLKLSHYSLLANYLRAHCSFLFLRSATKALGLPFPSFLTCILDNSQTKASGNEHITFCHLPEVLALRVKYANRFTTHDIAECSTSKIENLSVGVVD